MWSGWLFFGLFFRRSVPGRFIPLFYELHGIKASGVGLILSICSVAGLVSTPFLAHTADKLSNRHMVLIVCELLGTIFFFLQIIVFVFLQYHKLFLLILLGSLSAAFTYPAYSLVSAIALDGLTVKHGRRDAPLYFGSVRLWGAVSWAVGGVGLGAILDLVKTSRNVVLTVYGLGVMVSIAFMMAIFLDQRQYRKVQNVKKRGRNEGGIDENELSEASSSEFVKDGLELDEDLFSTHEKEHSSSVRIDINKISKNDFTKNADISDGDINYDANRNQTIADKTTATKQQTKIQLETKQHPLSEPETLQPPPPTTTTTPSVVEEQQQLSLIHALYPVVCGGGIWTMTFFTLMFCLGLGMSIVENLIFVFFRDELSASYTLCGLSVVITVIFEVPLFARADSMLRYMGAPLLLSFGALAYVVRTIGYSFVPSAWHVLLLEPLHGVTFGAVHAASVAIVAQKATGKYVATAQAVLEVVTGCATVFGALFGGLFIQKFGSRLLYRSGAIVVLLATIGFLCVNFLVPQNEELEEDNKWGDENGNGSSSSMGKTGSGKHELHNDDDIEHKPFVSWDVSQSSLSSASLIDDED